MNEEHPSVRLARRFWIAVADGDAEAVQAVLSDDVVWHTHGRNPLAGVFRGPEAVLDFLARSGELTDELNGTLDSIFFNDVGAVLALHIDARRGPRRLDTEVLVVLYFREGKIARATLVPADQEAANRFWS